MEMNSFKMFMLDVGLLGAKSLRAFCEKYKPEIEIRSSMSNYREQDWMVNVPLYILDKYLDTM